MLNAAWGSGAFVDRAFELLSALPCPVQVVAVQHKLVSAQVEQGTGGLEAQEQLRRALGQRDEARGMHTEQLAKNSQLSQGAGQAEEEARLRATADQATIQRLSSELQLAQEAAT